VPDLAANVSANRDDLVMFGDESDNAIDAPLAASMRFFLVRLS
jgi:hypothetical protein